MKGYSGLLLAQLGLVLTISLFAAITACRAVAPGLGAPSARCSSCLPRPLTVPRPLSMVRCHHSTSVRERPPILHVTLQVSLQVCSGAARPARTHSV